MHATATAAAAVAVAKPDKQQLQLQQVSRFIHISGQTIPVGEGEGTQGSRTLIYAEPLTVFRWLKSAASFGWNIA